MIISNYSIRFLSIMSDLSFQDSLQYDQDSGEEETDYDVDDTLSENKNTKRKTETDMRIFSAYLVSMKEKRPAEEVPPTELDQFLTMFFSVVKKHDGNEYEPASLRGMLCSIERYLRMKGYPNSVTRDIVFLNTRNTLKAKQRKLRENGKGAKKIHPEPLGPGTIEKLNHLYEAKELGPFNPMAIINSLCFAFVVHFRMRKAIDHKQLLWGDVTLRSTNSSEYLCYEPLEGYDHLRTKLKGSEGLKIWSHRPESSQRDPVAVYKVYATKRPSPMMSPGSPFYLGMATIHPLPTQPWYKSLPMGVNKLNDLVRMIREITGIPRTTNNSPIESLLTQPGSFALQPSSSSISATKAGYLLPDTVSRTADSTDNEEIRETVSAKQDGGNFQKEDESSMMAVDLSKTDVSAEKTEKQCSLGEAKERVRDLITSLEAGDVNEFLNWLNILCVTRDPNTGELNIESDQDGGVSNLQLKINISRKQLLGRRHFSFTGNADICNESICGMEVSTERPNDVISGSDSVTVTDEGQRSTKFNRSEETPRKRIRSAHTVPPRQVALQRTKSNPESMTLNEYLEMMGQSRMTPNDDVMSVPDKGGNPASSSPSVFPRKRQNSYPSSADMSSDKKTKGNQNKYEDVTVVTNGTSQDNKAAYTNNQASVLNAFPSMLEASLATSQMLASSMFPQFPQIFNPLSDPRAAMLLAQDGFASQLAKQNTQKLTSHGDSNVHESNNHAAPQAAHIQGKSLQMHDLFTKMATQRAEFAAGNFGSALFQDSRETPLPAHQQRCNGVMTERPAYNTTSTTSGYEYNVKKEA